MPGYVLFALTNRFSISASRLECASGSQDVVAILYNALFSLLKEEFVNL